jgi:hypothetical protein
MNTTDTMTTSAHWSGCFRENKRAPWRRLVVGELSYDSAWDKLLTAVDRLPAKERRLGGLNR